MDIEGEAPARRSRGRPRSITPEVAASRNRALWETRCLEATTKSVSVLANLNVPATVETSLAPRPMTNLTIEDFKFFVVMFTDTDSIPSSDPRLNSMKPMVNLEVYRQSLTQEDRTLADNFLQAFERDVQFHRRRRRTNSFLARYGLQAAQVDVPVPQHPRVAAPPDHGEERPPRRQSTRRFATGVRGLNLHLHQHIPITRVAQMLGISPRVIYRLKAKVRHGSISRVASYHLGQTQHPNQRYNDITRELILSQVQEAEGRMTLTQIKNSLANLVGPQNTPSRMTISRMLRGANFTRKLIQNCPAERNTEANKDRRLIYFHQLCLALAQGRRVISVDETGVNSDPGAGFHYAPAGVHWTSNPGRSRIPNTSCLFAISQHGVEQTMFIGHTCDSVLFAYFLYRLVILDPGFCSGDPARYPVLLLDNARIHQCSVLHKWLAVKGVKVLWTPPYHPMLNPVEFLNNQFKQYLQKGAIPPR